ncbi:MAG TPA: NADH-quinone oxidoreductase subunit L [Thermoanaerobaculia bacterium]|nr:NADH-quinone oxidoreductase subunit L [Thermoanaerobaculia bacterium]
MIPLWLLPLLPFAGFLLCGLLGRRLGKTFVTVCGVGSVALTTVLAYARLVPYAAGVFGGNAAPVVERYGSWIRAGNVAVDFAMRLDPLSALMLSFVTFVGLLIHVYSVGYMHAEEGYWRYFSYLNLFMFSMLTLVLGANFLILFVGWEGVGLCSYLLIAFDYQKESSARAGRKAFVANRVGDFGFLIGLFLILGLFGTLEFDRIFPAAAAAPGRFAPAMTAIALCLFVGACGKSAQLPLYVWLPDAMAGPTPVSALIHAATMVTAGVYVVARANVFFRLSPTAMAVVAIVGGATALFAAIIGTAQTDIKKVLAYSTISQLGYMFLACGVGAFVAGMFHVLTHAFFKALLFLGSGSVIHAMGGEQDMRRMGGLRRALPVTFWTFLAATLAIAGIPIWAGFFSKDEILGAVFARNPILWGIGFLAAGLTSFYMFRVVYLTFFGTFRGTEEEKRHLHESPPSMTIPLVILAVLSTAGGLVGLPALLGPRANLFHRFLDPIVPPITGGAALGRGAQVAELSRGTEIALIAASVGIALLGWIVARVCYSGDRAGTIPERFVRAFPGVHLLVSNKFYVDELYEAVIYRPFRRLSRMFWKVVDTLVIDGLINAGSFLVELSGDLLRFFTTGNVRNYALTFLLGIVALLAYLGWAPR